MVGLVAPSELGIYAVAATAAGLSSSAADGVGDVLFLPHGTERGLADSPTTPLANPVCDPREAYSIRDLGETVPLLRELDTGLTGLAGDPLVPIEDDLGRERGMPTDLDRHMPPIPIHDAMPWWVAP